MKNFFKFLLIVLTLSVLAGCGGAGSDQTLDVFAQMDESSIQEIDGTVYFNTVAEDGTTVRFRVKGGTVSKDKIMLEPGGSILALDATGKIYSYVISITENGHEENWLNTGGGYSFSETPGVEDESQIVFGTIYGRGSLDRCENAEVNVSEYTPNYAYISSDMGSPAYFVIEKLAINYDSQGSLTDFADNELVKAAFGDELVSSGEVFDVIAGIDESSIVNEGKTVTFTSNMEDGTPLRFYGKDIIVTKDTIEFLPTGELYGLDAIGQIYGYKPAFTEAPAENTWLKARGGFTFDSAKTSVDSIDELIFMDCHSIDAGSANGDYYISVDDMLPNFICYTSDALNNTGSYTFNSFHVYYDSEVKTTPIAKIALNTEFYGQYLEGEKYDAKKENMADLENGILSFYLRIGPDTEKWVSRYEEDPTFSDVYLINFTENYTTGNLKDAQGNVLDKNNAKVYEGTTLEVTIGEYTVDVELPTAKRYDSATVMHDLVPYAFPEATGTLDVLVVPVAWANQPEQASQENYDLFRKMLGRVADENGNVTDYSDPTDEELSFTEYFDIASYGKLDLQPFMTDWYHSGESFEKDNLGIDRQYGEDVLNWVKQTYPDMDWTRYDRDQNGYVDAMIIINAGDSGSDSYETISLEGAIFYRELYTGALAGTPDDPTVNTFTSINKRFLEEDHAATLIHEFSHNLGLIDYYDVTYSGINAVGNYDMQSGSHGDWNAYSKYAVGWVEPEIVKGLAPGESVEYTIGSMATTGDVLVIPAAEGTSDGEVFSEYVMVDLFHPDGAHIYDAQEYGLENTTGVRIYHVNANMEHHVETVDGVSYDIGTIHHANAFNPSGFYNVELIQSGGVNTFTDLEYIWAHPEEVCTNVEAEDFFYAGDVFTAETYSTFFADGKMDDGTPFGYRIEVVSVTGGANPAATIRVTRQ